MAGPGVVEVWWARVGAAGRGAASLLDDDERGRLAVLHHAEARDRFVAAHALARLVLGRVTGTPPEALRFARTCRRCGGHDHGKPALVAEAGDAVARFSLSGAGDRVVVAVAGAGPMGLAGPVGVDVEPVDEAALAGVDEVALSPAERRALAREPTSRRAAARATWWVRKEAVLKATGHGLSVDPAGVVVTGPGEPPRLLAWPSAPSPPGPAPAAFPDDVWMADVDLGAGWACAVAGLGPPAEVGPPTNADGLLATP
jgi:4'-phosphopantetheinyl transferase